MELNIKEYAIVISPEVRFVLDFHKQRERSTPESGGIILGKLINGKIHLIRLSVPTQLDKQSRKNFERHRLSAQIIIDYEFFNSNQQITYLGEWHTHPENTPIPSSIDLSMIKNQYTNNKYHTDFLILLIQGLEKLYVGIIDKTGLYFEVIIN